MGFGGPALCIQTHGQLLCALMIALITFLDLSSPFRRGPDRNTMHRQFLSAGTAVVDTNLPNFLCWHVFLAMLAWVEFCLVIQRLATWNAPAG
jgi:hypothetical protein